MILPTFSHICGCPTCGHTMLDRSAEGVAAVAAALVAIPADVENAAGAARAATGVAVARAVAAGSEAGVEGLEAMAVVGPEVLAAGGAGVEA